MNHSDPWRYRCPNGHVDVSSRTRATEDGQAQTRYYCRTCLKYGHDPHHETLIDKKTGAPV